MQAAPRPRCARHVPSRMARESSHASMQRRCRRPPSPFSRKHIPHGHVDATRDDFSSASAARTCMVEPIGRRVQDGPHRWKRAILDRSRGLRSALLLPSPSLPPPSYPSSRSTGSSRGWLGWISMNARYMIPHSGLAARLSRAGRAGLRGSQSVTSQMSLLFPLADPGILATLQRPPSALRSSHIV